MQLAPASRLPKSFSPAVGPIVTAGSHVYLMSVPSGKYKIGIAKDPQARLAILQTGNPERISLEGYTQSFAWGIDPREFERRLHTVLAEYRLCGEWFGGPVERVYIAIKYVWLSFVRPELIERWHRLNALS